MNFFHDEGIVLKKYRVREKDEIVILLTREHGKMAFFSFGSRAFRSRKAGALQLFHTISFQARKSKSSLPTLLQIKVLESRGFSLLQDTSLKSFYTASELLKLTDSLVPEGEKVEAVFDDLNRALDRLHHEHIFLIYCLRLMTDLGFLPSFSHCVSCHEKFLVSDDMVFFEEYRGIIHEACVSTKAFFQKVSVDQVKAMTYFQKNTFLDAVKLELPVGFLDFLKEKLKV